jgi:histidine triad (HIT) family protein
MRILACFARTCFARTRFARTRLADSLITGLIAWMLAHMSFLIPVQRLRETASLLAFYHPQPSYPVHILIVPKRAIASLLEITPADQQFLVDLFTCVRELVQELHLDQQGYRLIANGGDFQDIPQLHFHLIAGA